MKTEKQIKKDFFNTGEIKIGKQSYFDRNQIKSLSLCLKAIKGLSYKQSEDVLYEAISESKRRCINP